MPGSVSFIGGGSIQPAVRESADSLFSKKQKRLWQKDAHGRFCLSHTVSRFTQLCSVMLFLLRLYIAARPVSTAIDAPSVTRGTIAA